jgi:ketosteroid isomerase-like protein
MKYFLITFLLAVSTVVCFAQGSEDKIMELLDYQTKAWNEGDIDRFMEIYWNSPNLKFVGKSGITYGWKNTLNRYKKTYSSREEMGILSFEILEIEKLSDDLYLVIGKWKLNRESDEPGGHFSLIWKKIDNQWRIIADHTS